MPSVLDGVRAIDFSQYIAGPLAGMLLANQGADVIRVDSPGGPVWETPADATWNRSKRGITLNLKQPDDRAIGAQLIESADVMNENFRPGVMDSLGREPQAALKVNPRLIYCSLPGFASDVHAPRCALPLVLLLVGMRQRPQA
jgi:crotonobetainyl-CoA:carnitine CoA-transferase CaiB-like acyl-CoA transferase